MNKPDRTQLRDVSLDDKYELNTSRAFMTGIEALVRLPLLQHQKDIDAGLNTAGFISGYRGSPLGTLDQSLWHAKSRLDQHNIHFQPGVNEDLAATSVWGTQQVHLLPGAKYDGVFSMWYGKGPGVDRSMDVIKHANLFGTTKHGGVLAVAGDDHACKSSTVPHQSEHMFIAASVPVLNPVDQRRPHFTSAVGEDPKSPCHAYDRGLAGSQRHGQHGLKIVVDAEPAGILGHQRHAHVLRQADGHDVSRKFNTGP